MRWSEFFIPTAKETPADAVVPSHRLLIRAGLVRQVAAGSYAYLPLGYRVLRKIESIVREEMNAAGAIELHLPAMVPLSWYEQTGPGRHLRRHADQAQRQRVAGGDCPGPHARGGHHRHRPRQY